MYQTLENPIKVSEKIKKMVEGSTEFNIEKFMNESEVENYKEWLEVKKELSIQPPINVKTKKPYNGLQGDTLLKVQSEREFESNEWGTFLCWKQLGRSINKGEKGILCFYPTIKRTDKVDKDGNIEFKKVRNYFKVFNYNQTSPSKVKKFQSSNGGVKTKIKTNTTTLMSV